jgi:ATP synthase F1 subcomplex beta subunit
MNVGKVVQVIGPTVDVAFEPDQLPRILNAIRIEDAARGIDVTVEAALHVGDNQVRCVAMSSTEGLVRGMKAVDQGGPIAVPVGEQCLGRLFNLLGHTIDGKPQVETGKTYPIHRSAPSFEEQETTPEQFETGIKVVDLLAPTCAVARSASSAAPAWARPCSSRSSSATSPPSTAATRSSPASASAPARATTYTAR